MDSELKLEDLVDEELPPQDPLDEPKVEEPVVEAPGAIQKHFPSLAARWDRLDAEAREAAWADLAERLETAPGVDADGKGNASRPGEAAAPDPAGEGSGRETDPFANVPTPVSEKAILKLKEALGDDPEVNDAIDELTKGVNWMRDVGVETARGLKEHGDRLTGVEGDVAPIREQRQLEDSLVTFDANNDGALGKLSEPQYKAVSSTAIQWRRANPTASWDDAIELALTRTVRGKAVLLPKPPDPERSRRSSLASAAASRGGKPSDPQDEPAQSLDDLDEAYNQAVLKLGR